jgi:hypothetical protein
MKRFSLLAFVLAALVIAGILVVQQTLSREGAPGTSVALGDEAPTDIPAVTVLPADTSPQTGGTPVPTPQPVTPVSDGTAVPVPDSPDPAPVLAADTVLAEYTFDDGTLDGWTFAQVLESPLPAESWIVEQGELIAPDNTINGLYHDTLALAPLGFDDSGAIQVNALAFYRGGAEIGIVLGYDDPQNYTALILTVGSDDVSSSAVLRQVVNDEYTDVATTEDLTLDQRTWYTLRVAVDGTDVTATLDGEDVLATALPTALAGERFGVYADANGFHRFDNLRVFGN